MHTAMHTELLLDLGRPAVTGGTAATPPRSLAETAPTQPKASGLRRPQPAPRRERQAATAETTESQTPKWKGLERKELRLGLTTLDELARRRRALNRQRRGRERITCAGPPKTSSGSLLLRDFQNAAAGDTARPDGREHGTVPGWACAMRKAAKRDRGLEKTPAFVRRGKAA